MTENERLTIDEIIEHCNRTCENTEMLAIARGQNQEDITSKGYWEHYQVANYLEELKQYRAIGTVEEFKHYKHTVHMAELAIDSIQKEKAEIRNKAIDEFAEKVSLEISESIICGMIFDNRDNSSYDTSDKIVDYVIDTVKKVAEQMKEVRNE